MIQWIVKLIQILKTETRSTKTQKDLRLLGVAERPDISLKFFTSPQCVLPRHYDSTQSRTRSSQFVLGFRSRLHQVSLLMLLQCCNDASDIVLIENNEVAPKWGCKPLSSDFIVINGKRITSIITELSQL